MRTGQNLLETTLTLQNVQSSTFGKLFTLSVDGKVDAQPLVAANVDMPGVGVRNVVFVATEHDSVYAFDADTGTKYWQISLLKTGETSSDTRNCSQVSPEIGVTATPVIDAGAGPHGTIYVVAMSKDGGGGYHQRLHGIDITNGAEQFSGPVDIQATYPGTGDNSSGGNVVFDPKQYKARPGLLLVNGVVYTSWSSHCDIRPYTGWAIGYNQTTLGQTSVFNFTPNGNEAAIWGAGAGASADSAGNLFFQLGNGTFDTTLDVSGFPNKGDFGNAFVKVSLVNGALKAMDYWTMFNTVTESNGDQDLGSGGVIVLPDVTDGNQTIRHLGAGAGKDRNLYLFDRDSMGKFNPSTNGNIYQVLPTALGGSEFANPAWFNGLLYFGSVGDVIRGYKMTNAMLGTSPATSTLNSFAFPGTTPSISANGTSNAILWAVENSNPAKLHAYNATDLLTELYNTGQAAGGRDQFGSGNKFMTPTIVNGKVYVGTPNSVAVFGLLSTGSTPTLTSVSPSSGTVGTAAAVTLTGTNFIAGATVGVSGSGVTVSNVTVVSATQITATFTIAANATAGGRNVSVTTTGGTSNTQTFTVNSGTVSPTIAKSFAATPIPSGGSSLVTLTLANSNASALSGGAFTDTLTNMSAVGGAVGGTCTGTTPSSLAAGATALSFTGITIPASSSCTVTFSVTSSHLGGNPNTTSGVTTTQTPVAGSASNTATLTVTGAGGAGLNENFESGTSGWTATGLWHLTNSSSCAAPAAGYSSATHAYYYGQDASCDYNTGSNGNTGNLTSPSIFGITAQSTLQFSYYLRTEGAPGYDTAKVFVVAGGGAATQLTTVSTNDTSWHTVAPVSLSAFAGQTIQIRFTFDTVDNNFNTFKGWFVDDVIVTASGGGQPVSPAIAKAFSPASITSGGSSTVTLTLSNSNASALTGGAFTDTLTNMSAAGGTAGGTCTGTAPSSLTAGATALSFTGITIPASGSCTVTFSVTSSHVGGNPNSTSGVTTTQTAAGAASNSATLTVSAGLVSPTIAKAFSPASIASGGSSTVTLTLSNGNVSALTGGAFSDTLTNMSAVGGAVGGTCAGTIPSSLTAGTTVLSFMGITIPANSSCTVTFSVTSSHVGGNPNSTSGVTTTQTAAGAASNSATLTVTAGVVSPTIAKAFSPASIASGGSSMVTLTLSNGNASALTGGAFTDALTNMSAVGGAVGGTCTGTIPSSLTAGATSLSFTGITIPASSSCTVTFSVTSSHVGGNPNSTSGVTTTQAGAGAASNSATLTVTGGGGGGLNENFESGAAGWSATGLWHLANNSSCVTPALGYSSPTHAYYYGQDASCDYNTGSGTGISGSLTSPAVAGITAQSTLRFSYYLRTEGTPGYDTATVFVVGPGGATTQLTTVSTNDTSWHTTAAISLAQFAGQTIQIRFTFDTVDNNFNNFKGWLVDDVVVVP